MSTAAPNLESEPKRLAQDPRWALARRIAGSSTFARSEQMPKLLLYVCKMTIADRAEEINEQRIGVEVFGRAPNYDPAVDGIVRSHATRLRQRLEIYFNGEGIHEPLRIEIPRGGYVPRFYPVGREANQVADVPVRADKSVETPTAELPLPRLPDPAPAPDRWFHWKWLKPFLVGLSLAAVAMAVEHHLRHDAAIASASSHSGIKQTEIERRFWGTVFPNDGRTLIVPGDSGLVLYETSTGQEVTLSDYIGGGYRDPNHIKAVAPAATQAVVLNLAGRRYTSIVDLDMSTELSHLPQWNSERAATVFARDLRPSDASASNLILIGSKEANPWVSLLEPSINFVLVSDKKWGFRFLNRHPQNGELQEYVPQEESGGIGAPAVYGDVVYLPNPSGRGMILVLGGLWMSGTQSAGNFVLDSARFSDWLKSIARPDGSIPPFELLISTKSLESSATDSTIIAKRVYSK